MTRAEQPALQIALATLEKYDRKEFDLWRVTQGMDLAWSLVEQDLPERLRQALSYAAFELEIIRLTLDPEDQPAAVARVRRKVEAAIGRRA